METVYNPLWLEQAQVADEVLGECENQIKKWGVQDHSDTEWMQILMEEVGEAAQCLNKMNETLDGIRRCEQQLFYRKEMIQVAAVSISAIENYDRRMEQAA